MSRRKKEKVVLQGGELSIKSDAHGLTILTLEGFGENMETGKRASVFINAYSDDVDRINKMLQKFVIK